MQPSFSRRDLMRRTGAVAAVAVAGGAVTAAANPQSPEVPSPKDAFSFCLNTSTIRGPRLSIVEKIEIAANAGYQGIEPWVREIDTYAKDGGDLAELRKRITDAGLTVESAVGFASWLADDQQKRAQGMENAKRDMELVAQIGGKRIAAPPAGATRESLALPVVAERYRALLELGESVGVEPQLELWGGSSTLSRLGELIYVAVESGHPRARLLPDVFHIYRGGSDFTGLRLIDGDAMRVFHLNDYPDNPPREEIRDAQRVYPGDGVAPIARIVRDLYGTGFRGALSLELFNPDYWKQDPATVAKTGLEKMQAVVEEAFA